MDNWKSCPENIGKTERAFFLMVFSYEIATAIRGFAAIWGTRRVRMTTLYNIMV